MYNPELTYVTANLEESTLEGVAPGNRVRLDVVAFSKPFRGRVTLETLNPPPRLPPCPQRRAG
jgi:multidrug resistance efflux pump